MIITRTPLRISFLGGNTDFREYFLPYDGFCISTTINKYIYCIIKKRFDDKIIVNYSKKETVNEVEEIQHDLVRECLKLLEIRRGIEISFLADIPTEGTGLGSSSAVTVGLLNGLHHYKGEVVNNRELAKEACFIEIDVLGKHIGVQDQYACAIGGLCRYRFSSWGIDSTDLLPDDPSIVEDFNNSLMLFYTGVTRKSDDILSTLSMDLETLHATKALALNGIDALQLGHLSQFGSLLDEYWQLKKQLSDKISSPEIDAMYDTAKEAGAIGGKIIGAGGGGFLLVMYPANKRAKIRSAMSKYQELPFRFEDTGTTVIFNGD